MSDSEDYTDEEVSEMEEEDEEEGEEGVRGSGGPGAAAARRPIYDVDGLHEKLEDIAWAEEQAWEETQAITAAEATQVDNVEDDLGRELAFYNQALGATVEAIQRFEAAGTSWHRPADYYAEMVKSDEHMAKVKDRLMYEQQQIEEADERRKAREQKAYSKQVQAQKNKERAADKKRQIEAVQQLRKQRQKSGFSGELNFDEELEGMDKQQQQQQQRRGGPQRRPGERFTATEQRNKSKKRMVKNAKYGFGGPKRLQKQNDAFSSADMGGFRPGRGGKGPGGKAGRGKGGQGKGGPGGAKGGAKGGVKKRPGKQRRQQAKAGRGRG